MDPKEDGVWAFGRILSSIAKSGFSEYCDVFVSETKGLSPARLSRGHPNGPFSAEAPVHVQAPPPKGFEQVRSEAAQPCGSSRRWEPSATHQKGIPWDSQCACTAPALTDHTLESPEEDVGRAESPAGAQWWTHIGDAPKAATAQRFRTPRSHTLTHSSGMRVP